MTDTSLALGFGSARMLFSRQDIRRLLIPLIIELSLSYFIGMVDTMMVASVGEAAVSAVSLIDSICVLFINIFGALGAGGAVVAGQYLGRKDPELARRSAEQIFVLVAVVSIALTALLLWGRDLIIDTIYGGIAADVRAGCSTYYSIVMFSVPCIGLFNAVSALLRATGDSRTPMLISLLVNLINIVGNAILIHGFHMGVAGAAIPTLVSRFVAMAVITVLALRPGFSLHLRGLRHYRPDRVLLKNIVSIGVPAGIENGMFQLGKLILMSLVATLPTAAITANAIGNTLGALHCVVGMAGNNAMTPVVSRCVGAGDYDQARWYIRYFLKFVCHVQGLVNVAFMLAIPLILRLYQVSPETWTLAVRVLVIHGVATITLWPFAFLLNNGMRAAGDSKYGMVISSIAMWVFRIISAYVMVVFFHLGVIGIWLGWVFDWLFRIAFFVPRYRGHIWETKAIK